MMEQLLHKPEIQKLTCRTCGEIIEFDPEYDNIVKTSVEYKLLEWINNFFFPPKKKSSVVKKVEAYLTCLDNHLHKYEVYKTYYE